MIVVFYTTGYKIDKNYYMPSSAIGLQGAALYIGSRSKQIFCHIDTVLHGKLIPQAEHCI